jgi:hypothetical protein
MTKNTDQISLKELILTCKQWFLYLRSKWLIIVIGGLLGGVFGYLSAYSKKPIYIARLSFALEDEKAGGVISGAMGLASTLGIDLGTSAGGAFSGANLIELMKSRTLVEKALLNPVTVNGKVKSLAQFYIEFNELNQGWDKNPELKNFEFLPNPDRSKYTVSQDSVLGKVYQSFLGDDGALDVSQKDKKISILVIEVKSENELFSKVFTENIAKEVSDFYIETKTKKAKANVAILERQADSVRTALNNAISGVAAANDNTFNLNPALAVNRTPSAKRQIDVQANTAILTQLVTNLEMARVTLRKETPLIQVIDRPILPLLKTKPSKLKRLILGGILLGGFTVVVLIGRRALKNIMQGV